MVRCEEEENGENGERGGCRALPSKWRGGVRMFLLRKEGGCVWLGRNKAV